MACILGFLVGGVSFLAFATHATPYTAGYPSVLSQEARAVFSVGVFGHIMFALVQGATAPLLYTGGNTSFNGFPFLASFVAEDRFLRRVGDPGTRVDLAVLEALRYGRSLRPPS
jgi:hypothetical protein